MPRRSAGSSSPRRRRGRHCHLLRDPGDRPVDPRPRRLRRRRQDRPRRLQPAARGVRHPRFGDEHEHLRPLRHRRRRAVDPRPRRLRRRRQDRSGRLPSRARRVRLPPVVRRRPTSSSPSGSRAPGRPSPSRATTTGSARPTWRSTCPPSGRSSTGPRHRDRRRPRLRRRRARPVDPRPRRLRRRRQDRRRRVRPRRRRVRRDPLRAPAAWPVHPRSAPPATATPIPATSSYDFTIRRRPRRRRARLGHHPRRGHPGSLPGHDRHPGGRRRDALEVACRPGHPGLVALAHPTAARGPRSETSPRAAQARDLDRQGLSSRADRANPLDDRARPRSGKIDDAGRRVRPGVVPIPGVGDPIGRAIRWRSEMSKRESA